VRSGKRCETRIIRVDRGVLVAEKRPQALADLALSSGLDPKGVGRLSACRNTASSWIGGMHSEWHRNAAAYLIYTPPTPAGCSRLRPPEREAGARDSAKEKCPVLSSDASLKRWRSPSPCLTESSRPAAATGRDHTSKPPRSMSGRGFEVVGTLPDYPTGHSKLLMRKRVAR
jgi:hypothetical protein